MALGKSESEIDAWETGGASPSRGDLTRLVKLLRRPSAVFFLPSPPEKVALPASFRRAPGLAGHNLQQEEIRDLRWARRLQSLSRWLLASSGAAPVNFPRSSLGDPPERAAHELRRLLDVSPAEQLAWLSASMAFRVWRDGLEGRGLLVLQLSLGRENIRGFSIWDDNAPLAAVNTAYHPTARIYTLFHEVGHLVLRDDSACFRFVGENPSAPAVERWCEKFAAHFLLPAESVHDIAYKAYGVTRDSPANLDAARLLAGRFKVSTRAMALRLEELRLATKGFYGRASAALDRLDWNAGGGGGGQTRVEKRIGQLGHRIPELVLAGEGEGRINRADAADYLRVTTGQVDDLRILLNVGS